MRDRFDNCLDGLLPDNGGAVLLAVSGGIDSMVMAGLFLESRHKHDITLAHCNFHLRGDESDSDEAFVRDWAREMGVPFLKVDFDTKEYAAPGIFVTRGSPLCVRNMGSRLSPWPTMPMIMPRP